MTSLIGLIGRKSSGKSTIAQHLADGHHFVKISFADRLKEMLKALGLTNEMLYGAEKETPIDWLHGKTPRYLMQTLGTEWGRNLVHPDIWINAAHIDINNCIALGGRVVVEDVRFPNEVALIRELKGEIWGVVRDAVLRPDEHISESLDVAQNADWMFFNNSTIDDLCVQIDNTMRPSR